MTKNIIKAVQTGLLDYNVFFFVAEISREKYWKSTNNNMQSFKSGLQLCINNINIIKDTNRIILYGGTCPTKVIEYANLYHLK